MKKEDSALMYQEEGVKPAKVMEYLKLRCISYQTYMYLVKCAMEKDITGRL